MRSSAGQSPERSSLARADAILACFDDAHPTMSLPAIVAATGLPKTTVHRAIEKLLELGWLEQQRINGAIGHGRDRYAVGRRLFEIATLAHLRTDLREAALPYMEDLYEATHETIHLAVLDGVHVLYAEKISGHRRITDLSRVGGRMPSHCTAVGKALLAFGPPEAVDAVIAEGLDPRTRTTITSPVKLRAELEAIRLEGVAYDREECDIGMACVAAPLFGPDSTCVGAMSITGPARVLRLDRLAPAVRTAALSASRALRTRVE
ncbi:IclR family transcriptional regulator [Pseudonocardia sp.]|uniref:IclR family transcriptional regulator n=1 Tax=Pseudonocardia sp. TaxID=60912 RepID=UPI003D09EC48